MICQPCLAQLEWKIQNKSFAKISKKYFLKLANNLLSEVVKILKLEKFVEGSEISILVTNNNKIQEINKEYRKKNKPTNVLSFPFLEFNEGKFLGNKKAFIKLPKPQMIGEVIISFEKCLEEATQQNKPFENHLSHLLIHSYLHIFGFDHISDKDAKRMEDLEIKILKKLGIKNPYNL